MFKRHSGEGDDFGISAGQRFRSRSVRSLVWEVDTVYRSAWEPTPHVRLCRVGAPSDRKTVALQTLQDDRYFEPAN
ncbi:MAG TPA: hypothetical protein VJR47_11980 [Stellaceae bacterium]|nr:hypothetical protein [Stellaceae bacterium]